MAAPLKTFVVYSSLDRGLRDEFLQHLRPLVRSKILDVWSDNAIPPGEAWNEEIWENLRQTDLFIPLVSVNFFNSEYIQDVELPFAEERRQAGRAFVLPVLLNHCSWNFDPIIKALQMLPSGNKPIVDASNRNQAWAGVIGKIGERAEQIRADPDFQAILATERKKIADAEAEQKRLEEEAIQREADQRAERENQQREAEQLRQEQERQRRRDIEAAEQRQREAEQWKKEQEQQHQRDIEAAEQRRRELEAERERQRQQGMQVAWSTAEAEHSASGYRNFYQKHPDSTFAREAKRREKMLRQSDAKPLPWRGVVAGAGLLVVAFWVWKMVSGGGVSPAAGLVQQNPPTPTQPIDMPKTQPARDTQKNDDLAEQLPVAQEKLMAQPPKDEPKPTRPTPRISEPEMIFVKGGTFQMGSNDGDDDEKPVHSVTLGDFYIGKYEVTQKFWKEVMGSNPSASRKNCDNCPVEMVSWERAQEFLKKLNQMLPAGQKPYRLPTEAEWEYAARGGSQSKGYIYAGSNNLGEVAWYRGNSGGKTHPVGSKKSNELGIFDMSGNVFEWCQDEYHNTYSGAPTDGSAWTSRGHEERVRVHRGGTWVNYADCRSADRDSWHTTSLSDYFGFRLVR